MDDFIFASSRAILEAALQAVRAEWKASEPEWCGPGFEGSVLKYLGIQVSFDRDGYVLSQEDLIWDILAKRGFEISREGIGSCGPMSKEVLPEEAESVDGVTLRAAQAAVGELLWLAIKTRPDIAYITSRLSLLCSRCPNFVCRKADEVYRYLAKSCTLGLRYSGISKQFPFGRDGQLHFEAYSDASFAAGCTSDTTARSHTGGVVTWCDAPVMWMSTRQTIVATSTAEAEVNSAADAAVMLQSSAPLIASLCGVSESALQKVLYCDSVSACSLMTMCAGSWRTRHLRISVAGVRTLVERNYLVVAHLRGEWMLAIYSPS